MNIVSHTLVKNGMPFIGKVLEQVIPYMTKCVVDISHKSNDGTVEEINRLDTKYPGKLIILADISKATRELTTERQRMVYTYPSDWILFLDDDDYWPRKSIVGVMEEIEKNEHYAYAVNPYQVVNKKSHDNGWSMKWFTKWFKNKDINYRGEWPRDLIYTGSKPLYWRQNSEVVRLFHRFYHLSLVKEHSFRNEEWSYEYRFGKGEPDLYKFNEDERKIIDDIFRKD